METTLKQRRFVAEYLQDQNATQAAIRAGYSARTAKQQASRLLVNVAIRNAIEATLRQHEVNADWIIQKLRAIADANMQDFVAANGNALDLTKLDREKAGTIQEYIVDVSGGGAGDGKRERVMRKRIRLKDSLTALIWLGKYLKMFTEKVELGFDDELTAAILEGRARVAAAIQIG